jgi:DNA (cytosine-5)-methyltransferase 1
VLRFVDLFSGCGGLSLGLAWSGAQGLFAIERDPMAFQTFKANFIDQPRGPVLPFVWPEWLKRQAWGIDDLLEAHGKDLAALRDAELDLVAGGPPCQGFSFAGRRDSQDPRNQLFTKYLEVVRLIRPTAVLLENVPGMAVAHGSTITGEKRRARGDTKGSFYETLAEELGAMGYDVDGQILDASEFGVPQKRSRLIVVGLLRERLEVPPSGRVAPLVFERLKSGRQAFLDRIGLKPPVSAREAIGDLSIVGRNGRLWDPEEYDEPDSPRGYYQLTYDGRRSRSPYQQFMRAHAFGRPMDSMRLARHSSEVSGRFRQIIQTCRQGVRMNDGDRAWFKLRKHRIYPMSASEPAPTITTLPDDVLHYSDPRILTVRETARLQSFPDWFVFKGKYTTGGEKRTKECPRYTQVGNAVPPLFAFAIAKALEYVITVHRIAETSIPATVENPRRLAEVA